MASITLLKYTVSSPADDSPLQKLEAEGYSASDILGVVGKTEGMSIHSLTKYSSILTALRQWLRERLFAHTERTSMGIKDSLVGSYCLLWGH
jgi:hypothetical protein